MSWIHFKSVNQNELIVHSKLDCQPQIMKWFIKNYYTPDLNWKSLKLHFFYSKVLKKYKKYTFYVTYYHTECQFAPWNCCNILFKYISALFLLLEVCNTHNNNDGVVFNPLMTSGTVDKLLKNLVGKKSWETKL